MHATQAGMILGTAGVHVARAGQRKPVDKRADIWAFGVVMYELLTGETSVHGRDDHRYACPQCVLQAEPKLAGCAESGATSSQALFGKRSAEEVARHRRRDGAAGRGSGSAFRPHDRSSSSVANGNILHGL